ncbi:MAG: [Clostridia bacterium]|nr:[FeFe] hydrogenase H-cluster maturation GTPase HydF [Clostridia bacterium]
MSLQNTPSGERLHIGFFGRRNAGKSSLVNAVTNQELSVVSDVKGTTTDPVSKAMELLPLGPVVIIDTPGFDDEGMLGEKRIQRTKQILNRADIAVLVVDAAEGKNEADAQLEALFAEKGIPYIVVYNKSDLQKRDCAENEICVSALNKDNIEEFKNRLATLAKTDAPHVRLVGDFIKPGDLVVLVTPIDAAAPKGRLILPQQMAIRDILDAGAMAAVTKETELEQTLDKLTAPPALVVTDSQVFGFVSKIVPPEVKLTSFSILMARYKGFLETAVRGAAAIGELKDGDTILISEGCTHHRQCGDIGSVKLPMWLKKTTTAELNIETSSGLSFPEDLSKYALVIHCGGCMLNEREVTYRRKCAEDAGVPFTNYGTAIAYMHGILKRSLAPMPELEKLLEV